jgi:hypothetical protein
LVEFEGLAVAVDEVPEEVHQFRLVVAIVRLAFNEATNLLDQFYHVDLIEQHGFVVIVHFL